MNRKFIFALIASFSLAGISAQNAKDPVLMKINKRPVKKSEFEYLYKKNNTASQQSLDDYLKLFVDYKLKVEEAVTQGYDTAKVFVSEYNSYKNQITQPYLVDTLSEQTIAKREYDRRGQNIESSHILVRFPQGSLLPKDTLEAYQKALSIREKLFGKDAISFEEAAKQYSEDPSAKFADPAGSLGWATALMFVSPFEDALYATAKGKITMPVRSMYGYHIIKVQDKKEDQGKVSLAHIMFSFSKRDVSQSEKDSLKNLADDVYKQLLNGGNYKDLCTKYSSDKNSSVRGGSMGWAEISSGFPATFMTAAYALKDTGDISKPIETPFGYHIIKLEDKAPRVSWAESKKELVSQIKRSDLLDQINSLQLKSLAKEIPYKVNDKLYKNLIGLADSYFPTDSAYSANVAGLNETFITINKQGYSLKDFVDYLPMANGRYNVSTDFLENAVNSFVLNKIKDEYIGTLDKKYPEYANLLKEYHDGILLFNVMNQEVWEKAANDTVGLTNYFKNNKTKYTWDAPHYKGYIVFCKDEASFKKAQELAKGNKEADLSTYLKGKLNNDSVNFVLARRGVWAKGDNKFVDVCAFNVEEKPDAIKDYPFYFVSGEMLTKPEDYLDVKGLVISDLQEQTEKEWIAKLRDKYSVEIDNKVLKTIK